MNFLATTLTKLNKALIAPEVAAEQAKEEAEFKKEDPGFQALPSIGKEAMIDELRALNAVTPFQLEKLAEDKSDRISTWEALAAYKRLKRLDKKKPETGQLARGAGVGAVAGPIILGVGDLIAGKHGKGVKKSIGKALQIGTRKVLARAAVGAGYGGAIPYARHKVEHEYEKGKLKKYISEHKGGKLRKKLKRKLRTL